MKVKIQCSCSSKFEFEVEPVMGAMPVPIYCPTCGIETTEAANAIIRQQLSASTGVGEPAPLSRSRLSVAHTSVQGSSLPVGQLLDETGEAQTSPPGERCSRHPQEDAVEHCYVCSKAICPVCMEKFGYVCSVFCLGQAQQRRIKLPVYAHQTSVVQARQWARTKLWIGAAAAFVALLVAGWIWYALVGSKPRVIYSLKLDKASSDVFTFARPGQLLRVNLDELTLHDVAKKREIWKTKVSDPSSDPLRTQPTATEILQKREASKGGDDLTSPMSTQPATRRELFFDDEYAPKPQVHVTENDIWVIGRGKVFRFDVGSGAQKETVLFEGDDAQVRVQDEVLLIRSDLPTGETMLTWIDPRQNKTDRFRIPRTEVDMKAVAAVNENRDEPRIDPAWKDYVITLPGVAELDVKLTERKMTSRVAMKTQNKPALSGNLNAAGSMDAAMDLLNEMKRESGGGVTYEDESLYQLVMKRIPAAGPEISLTVSGRPSLFSAKTVDAVIAGKSIYAFDRQNKKLWESKLAHSMGRYDADDSAPVLEVDDALYVFDPGMLTCFDKGNGNVRWRLPSVGISLLQVDHEKKLYVSTTSADPESLKFSEQVAIGRDVVPVLLKVDPSNGKILWKLQNKSANDTILSDKYLYASRIRTTMLDRLNAAANSQDPQMHFHLYRVNPDSGKVMWDHYEPRGPQQVEAKGKYLLFRFNREAQVLTYWSF